jgi:hypothetical protein
MFASASPLSLAVGQARCLVLRWASKNERSSTLPSRSVITQPAKAALYELSLTQKLSYNLFRWQVGLYLVSPRALRNHIYIPPFTPSTCPVT